MTITTLTRFRVAKSAPYYIRCDEIALDTAQDAEDINHILEQTQTARFASQPRAWGFGRWADDDPEGGNSKRTWRDASAIVLDFQGSADRQERNDLIARLYQAAKLLDHGFWLIETCDRGFAHTVTVAFPVNEPITAEARYARLAGVLYEQLNALGIKARPADGFTAMTHLVHVHPGSEAVWHPAPTINVRAKIAATSRAAQDTSIARFSAANAQLDEPVRTFAVDPELFEGLVPSGR